MRIFAYFIFRPWTMQSTSGDDEAPKDPRIGDPDFTQQFTESDFDGEFFVRLFKKFGDKSDKSDKN